MYNYYINKNYYIIKNFASCMVNKDSIMTGFDQNTSLVRYNIKI